MLRFTAIIFLISIITSCKKGPIYIQPDMKIFVFEDISADVKVPYNVWNILEGIVDLNEKDLKAQQANTQTGEALFAGLKIYITEKTPDIVQGKSIEIQLPRGGGFVDLSKFIREKNGTFYIGFDYPEFENASIKKVAFVSRTKKRKIDGRVVGSGCNVYFDITDAYFKNMKSDGIKVNTTAQRHLGILGGTFLFSAKNQDTNQIYVSHVTFIDSNHQELFCEE